MTDLEVWVSLPAGLVDDLRGVVFDRATALRDEADELRVADPDTADVLDCMAAAWEENDRLMSAMLERAGWEI